MTTSILNSTKKILGLADDYDVFDLDIITHINSVLSDLAQLGVGPVEGFMIENDTSEWGDLLGRDPKLSLVKSYVYLRVRLMFDPPANSFGIDSMQKQIDKMEWRLSVETDPAPVVVVPEDLEL